MRKAIFTRKFSAAHRLANDPSPCERIHGHNYTAQITVVVEELSASGFTVPADEVKEVVDKRFDHRLILQDSDPLVVGQMVPLTGFQEDEGRTRFSEMQDMIVRVPFIPTTENLAQEIAECVGALVEEGQGSGYVGVVLEETETIMGLGRHEW